MNRLVSILVSISEASKILGVSITTLRCWEKVGRVNMSSI
ncbi:MAG: MerR family DNA-binding transcriptional regulator [Synergistaceae bacterium]|nr:MerR family DNA-binding transcriptional regulator [Synergistaceae bacterium]